MARKTAKRHIDDYDNNFLFGTYKGQPIGLSLNNKLVNRSANALVIGGTGTGKTFKYVKPNLLQENCSIVVTDPSGDIFRSFAPYLIRKGYNVQLFNISDPTVSCHYNPLAHVYDIDGNISEREVQVLADLYLKNAKRGKEAGSSDPFWEKAELQLILALMYYVLENDEFSREDKCFTTVYHLATRLNDGEQGQAPRPGVRPLEEELQEWYARCEAAGKRIHAKDYFDGFFTSSGNTRRSILISAVVDLQIFAVSEIARVTRTNVVYKDANINIDRIANQQSYLFLSIPQAHEAYNFLVAMLYSQLYSRLYQLGERGIRGKWHIGYRVGTPIFDPFDSEELAKEFYETITKEDNILERDYLNGMKIYHLMWHGKSFKTSFERKPLEDCIDNLKEMVIWSGEEVAGGDPALPTQVLFLLDEFANIGEIPNFRRILSTSRKYRIGSHVIIQNIGQLKGMYKESQHENVLANVDTTVFLGSIMQEDKEYIQKMLGKTTYRKKSTSSSKSGPSTSYSPEEAQVLTMDQIEKINQGRRDDEIVIVRDCAPFLCQKLNLTKHKRYGEYKKVKMPTEDLYRYFRNDRQEEPYH